MPGLAVPSTVLALVLFLCFVTPGLLFELLRERSRPARQYSAIRETSVVVAASVLFTLPAAALLLLLRLYLSKRFPASESKWFPDFEALAGKPAQYSATHLAQVIIFILALLAIAGLLAFVVDRIFRRLEPPGGKLRNNPIWFDLLDGPFRPSGAKAVIAAVELKNGGIVLGAVVGYESKADQALAWLVLRAHSQIEFAVSHPDGNLLPVGQQWQYMFIPGDEVRAVSAGFSDKE